jgi:hypothetical protein
VSLQPNGLCRFRVNNARGVSFSGEKRGICGENIGGGWRKSGKQSLSGEKCKFAGEKKCIIRFILEYVLRQKQLSLKDKDTNIYLLSCIRQWQCLKDSELNVVSIRRCQDYVKGMQAIELFPQHSQALKRLNLILS